ncbi:MAG: ABC transporter ATP-binding protein [Desulfovibrionaceae bacterium]
MSIFFDNISIGYNNNLILQDITTYFPEGKILFILGGSGCGKSTLLKTLLGLLPPLSGTMLMNDIDFYGSHKEKQKELQGNMGVLFQEGALLDSLTVGENISLVLEQHTTLNKQERQEKIEAILTAVHLEHVYHYYPSALSGGMRKRVALARSLIRNPSLLFCDEPTSGLDPILSEEMDALLLSIQQQTPSMTLLIISHSIRSFITLADYAFLLHNKTLYCKGTKDDFLLSEDPYIQRFFGNKEY